MRWLWVKNLQAQATSTNTFARRLHRQVTGIFYNHKKNGIDMQKIQFLGKEVSIAFNVAVQVEYEDITGEAWNVERLGRVKNSCALYAATINVNNPDSPITSEEIQQHATSEEMTRISTAVAEEMAKWFKLPATMKEEPASEEEEKNA